jgi:ribosomal protein S18 acetylase RimI-like enzyme/ankyrin repeat protein
MSELPARPSVEHLRKAAKRLAKDRSLKLADAQRALANDYGFRGWVEMLDRVAELRGERHEARSLIAAVRGGDVAAVRELLSNGANPRLGDGREEPLHVAARRGPLALVETLIAGGSLVWTTDHAGRTPLELARRGRSPDREAIVALLDREAIPDRAFRAAVAAIHRGDVAGLERILDAEPGLLHERNVGPEAYREAKRSDSFRDPKLFWYIAWNPTPAEPVPENITEIARVMIERGVERDDLTYALGLVMSGSLVREAGHQVALAQMILAAGAELSRATILTAAGHRELDVLRALVAGGHPVDALLAAALGDVPALAAALAHASPDDIQAAFALAVINRRLDAVRLTLDAGADVNAYLAVHSHSTALHQAALDEAIEIVELLAARGARTDLRDRLWDATPLDWTIHQHRPNGRAALERIERRLGRTRIARAAPKDRDAAWAIVAEYCDALDIVVRDDPADFDRYFEDGSGVWLAHDGDAVVGCIALRPLPVVGPDAGEVKRLYVRPAARGRNLAGALLDELEAYARGRYRGLYLDTKDDLIPAIRFYERRGYARIPRYNDNPQATIFMRRLLV